MGSRTMFTSIRRSSKDELKANTGGLYNHLNDAGTKEETLTNTNLDLSLLYPLDYTNGRWLKNDQIQRESRYINFDFAALCRKAVELCQQARYVTSCEKKEGGFNRVFLFRMDSGERIVARLPTPIAGPRRLTTNSEVATLAYIRSKTSIPVPDVLDWSDDPANPTGVEYIFMNHVEGVQLHGRWISMTGLEHIQCIQSISMAIKEMAKLEFPTYGSLYFADAPIDGNLKIRFEEGFCIGPHCGSVFWNSAPGENVLYGNSGHDRGPWPDLRSYASGLVASGHSRIPDIDHASIEQLSYRGPTNDHVQLLRHSESIISALVNSPIIQSVARPTLVHVDLNKRNIFVDEADPTKLVSLIDWQSTSIEPAFVYAPDIPDFAARPADAAITDEEADQTRDQESEAQAMEQQTSDMLLCSDAFEVCMKGFVPILGRARSVDEALLRLFRHCNTSWRDSVVAVRQDLIDLSMKWTELGLSGKCPYAPSAEELAEHQAQWEDFESSMKLKSGLMKMLDTNSDGWVSADRWEVVKSVHDELYQGWLNTAKDEQDPDLSEDKARKLWPFDAVSSHGR